jgi:hypothetical protein
VPKIRLESSDHIQVDARGPEWTADGVTRYAVLFRHTLNNEWCAGTAETGDDTQTVRTHDWTNRRALAWRQFADEVIELAGQLESHGAGR